MESKSVRNFLVCLLAVYLYSPSVPAQGHVIRKDQNTSPVLLQPKKQEAKKQKDSRHLKLKIEEGFQFGSYGRVSVGSDMEGGTGRQVRVIAHPPRLLEAPYAEIDLSYTQKVSDTGACFHTQTTLALGEKLFHFTGDFTSDIAVRNLYLETRDALAKGLDIWAGSRMYRGDDVYLLDFWPLDEQNTVGGGLVYSFGESNVRLHVGFNRLNDKFQTQTIVVPGEKTGTKQVLFMDRQRTVLTLRGEHHFELLPNLKLKAVLYAEGHTLPSGVYKTPDRDEERLPADAGWLAGAEAGLYQPGTSNHLNLFARYASGLAAYDELAVPFGLDRNKKTSGAKEVLLALSGNYEPASAAGMLLGAYLRYFVDADPNVYDRDDAWELGLAFRPAWFVTEHFQLLGEVNMQYLRPNGLNPESLEQDKPLVVETAIMPSLSLGKGSYSRPQLRLIYALTWLNDAALRTFAPQDPLRKRSLRQFFGLSVEWWFHSSRYH
ncbi:MAG: carbohydrate porin [Deltaproteobacteria bacterium]|nr:carbohydrate porin [Deltaproteobacteria bacterium]